jgi:hypothetical protein
MKNQKLQKQGESLPKTQINHTILPEVQRRIDREKKRIKKLEEKFGCIFYGELLINTLYQLRQKYGMDSE